MWFSEVTAPEQQTQEGSNPAPSLRRTLPTLPTPTCFHRALLGTLAPRQLTPPWASLSLQSPSLQQDTPWLSGPRRWEPILWTGSSRHGDPTALTEELTLLERVAQME